MHQLYRKRRPNMVQREVCFCKFSTTTLYSNTTTAKLLAKMEQAEQRQWTTIVANVCGFIARFALQAFEWNQKLPLEDGEGYS